MNEAAFAAVADYGHPILFLATFLSCLAIPIPSSFIMLAGGAFVASGDLGLAETLVAAFAGAVAGDQAGYWLGTRGGRYIAQLENNAIWGRAERFLARHGSVAVFLSRWLFSPLGPYINFLSGSVHLPRARFTAAGMAGEAVWVAIYVGLGYAFAGQISALAELIGNFVGLLTAAALSAMAGRTLWRQMAGA